ncbi:sensor histidine kinase [Actinomadura parmotrematis]|uniref:histidine kinase n=1 Tax=Actinomadura parmotrematis TaxID=2864039 RepID=A0ABS7FUZ6_9ACTN|nr:histidine kinase [Actinomadura parmotrematis]MBW8484243.1 two-component sensor histidine kinase [Actinomadura parmotrematis]
MNGSVTGLDRFQSVGGCLARVALWGCAGLFLLLIMVARTVNRGFTWYDAALYAVAALASFAALARWRPLPWAVASAAASLVLTAVLAVADPPWVNPSVALEICALLVLVGRMMWQAPRPRLMPLAVLIGGAVVAVSIRGSPLAALVFSAPLAVLVFIAVGIGLYLRALDARRARALDDARRDERLDLARDLHDFVAHHVTGIVVQAQAARYAARAGSAQGPEELDAMFAGIERAGAEALTSMRRMVGLLRAAQDGPGEVGPGENGPGATRPVGDLARITDLVAGFRHPPATLTVAPGLGVLPPEVATTAHRIVQEALTNARKHAADATRVRVVIDRAPEGGVRVAVRDDGQGRGRLLPSGGFGLAGLGERVDAVGGRLRAGPRPEGGWEVVAVLDGPAELGGWGP